MKGGGAERPVGGVEAAKLTERLLVADVGAAEGELAPVLTEFPGADDEAERTELAEETEEPEAEDPVVFVWRSTTTP